MSAPAVPKELGYHLAPADSVAARSYRLNVSPYNNQTFKSGDVIKIKLPTNRCAYFDPKKSYLKFTVQCPANAGGANPAGLYISPDGHIASVISRLQSFSGGGSVLLETQEYSGALYTLMLDMQVPMEQRASGTYAILGGTADGGAGTLIPPGGADQFSFGLISGVFGAQATKMFPVGHLNDGLELHLYLADFKHAFTGRTVAGAMGDFTNDAAGAACAANITISNVEYVAEYCELNPNADAAISQINGNRFVIPNEQYRAVAVPITQGSAGTTSLLVNHRFSSVKNLWVGLYSNAQMNTLAEPGSSSRQRNTISAYQWRIGGLNVPQKPVNVSYTSASEGFAEIERALRGMNNILGSCSVTRARWSNAAAQVDNGAFAIATQLDVFDFTADKPARSGVSTLDSPLYLDLTWSAATTENLTAVVFVHFDSSIVIDGNTGSVAELH